MSSAFENPNLLDSWSTIGSPIASAAPAPMRRPVLPNRVMLLLLRGARLKEVLREDALRIGALRRAGALLRALLLLAIVILPPGNSAYDYKGYASDE